MPAKTPMYLKTSTPKRGKKLKLRDVLSSDMISPPLGDVRHSAHVGPEGERDMFGDVGFLQGKLDMLPALSGPHSRSHSIEHQLDEAFPAEAKYHHRHAHHAATLLKGTISMPVFVAPEQAPPKPPRLHLEETPSPSMHHQQQQQQQQQRSMSVCEAGLQMADCYGEHCHDFAYSASIPAFPRLVPSSGSFSEASSEDSMLDVCPPLDPRRGLSLDSDAGLSNEDLRSERSERSESPGVPRSESFMGLDLDLGPSILEDVLRIMDRYKTAQEGCEL